MMPKCPGQDDRNLKVEILKCPDCGWELEIFSDEINVRCSKCKALVCRERLPSCVDWCKMARECIGEEKWKKLKGGK
jgi:hypothetical protein